MATPRGYRSYAEFEREQIRPSMRIGWSVDEIEETSAEAELDLHADPFEAQPHAYDQEEHDDDDE